MVGDKVTEFWVTMQPKPGELPRTYVYGPMDKPAAMKELKRRKYAYSGFEVRLVVEYKECPDGRQLCGSN